MRVEWIGDYDPGWRMSCIVGALWGISATFGAILAGFGARKHAWFVAIVGVAGFGSATWLDRKSRCVEPIRRKVPDDEVFVRRGGSVRWQIDDTGVVIENAATATRIGWQDVEGVVESDDLFTIGRNDSHIERIAKRAFELDADLQRFREMLAQKGLAKPNGAPCAPSQSMQNRGRTIRSQLLPADGNCAIFRRGSLPHRPYPSKGSRRCIADPVTRLHQQFRWLELEDP
jgi:hypothetical protein